MSIFNEWFNSEPHRRKYTADHPVYLSAMEGFNAGMELAAQEKKELEKKLADEQSYCVNLEINCENNKQYILETQKTIAQLKENICIRNKREWDALGKNNKLKESNNFLKQNLLALYNMQAAQTDEMWGLINTIFDRSDIRNPVPKEK